MLDHTRQLHHYPAWLPSNSDYITAVVVIVVSAVGAAPSFTTFIDHTTPMGTVTVHSRNHVTRKNAVLPGVGDKGRYTAAAYTTFTDGRKRAEPLATRTGL